MVNSLSQKCRSCLTSLSSSRWTSATPSRFSSSPDLLANGSFPNQQRMKSGLEKSNESTALLKCGPKSSCQRSSHPLTAKRSCRVAIWQSASLFLKALMWLPITMHMPSLTWTILCRSQVVNFRKSSWQQEPRSQKKVTTRELETMIGSTTKSNHEPS